MTERSSIYINIAVEGVTDEVLLKKVIREFPELHIMQSLGLRGIEHLKKKLNDYNQAAQQFPFICLVDLDANPCPVDYLGELLPENPHADFLLRIAVKTLVAWIIADRKMFAAFVNAPENKLPSNPENEVNLKQTIVKLVRRYGNKELKRDMVPAKGSSGVVGNAYTTQIIRFIETQWRLEVAKTNAPSLQRACHAFERLIAEKQS